MAKKPSKKEEKIFYEALEKSPEQREAFLKEACGKDRQLYNRVEALLKAHDVDDSFLENPPMDSEVTVDTTPIREVCGAVIGRYKLLEQIGEGGMAVVFMAEQIQPFQRRVAIKIIKLGMDTKQVIARFEAERQALAMMDHPNIAKVHDAGTTETGRPYFVMELVRGISITEYCDRNNLSTQERLRLFIPVCQAIQHAHQKGIIHRDIKPSNVLVTMHDGTPMPKVIDFGIAKAVNQRLTEKTLFTRFAQMIGTPEYMSPEQAEMSTLDIDTRTDVYSLGVLLYELLTGTTPFEGKELRSKGYAEMQRVIRETEPVRPSTRISTLGDILTEVAKQRKTNPDGLKKLFRGDLDWIVMKTLEKDRTRRYETAHALAEDIRRHMTNEPVSAGSPTFSYRMQKFCRKYRRQIISTAAVLIVGIISIVMFARYLQITTVVREKEQALAAQEARYSLSSVQGLFTEGKYEQAVTELESLVGNEHVGADARLLHARLILQLGNPVEAVKKLEGLLDESDEVSSQAHLLLARIYLESDPRDAENSLFFQRKAREHQTKGEDAMSVSAESYYNRALMTGSVNETLRWLNRAIELEPGHFNALKARSITYKVLEKYDDLEIDASVMIGLKPNRPDGYVLRAIARRKKGLARNDKNLLKNAIQDHSRAIGKANPEDPSLAEYYNERRKTYVVLEDFPKALEDARECVRLSPDNMEYQFNVYFTLTMMGNLDDAESQFDVMLHKNPAYAHELYGWSQKHTFDCLSHGIHLDIPVQRVMSPPFYPIAVAVKEYGMLKSKFDRLIASGSATTWSPDGKELAYTGGTPGSSTINILNLQSGQHRVLATGMRPLWSPDGKYIAFMRNSSRLGIAQVEEEYTTGIQTFWTGLEVWIIQPDGDGSQLLTKGSLVGWDPDSHEVYFVAAKHDFLCLNAVDLEDRAVGHRQIMTLFASEPKISPDGRYLASADGWYCEIADMKTDNVIHRLKIPVGEDGGLKSWSPDGKYLFKSGGGYLEEGLWLADLEKQRVKKILDGIDMRVAVSPDMKHIVLGLGFPYFESWIIELDSKRQLWDQFESLMNPEEHWEKLLEDYAIKSRLYPLDPIFTPVLSYFQSACPIEKYRDGEQALVNAMQALKNFKEYGLPVMSRYWLCVADAYAALGDYDSAVEWTEKAIEKLPEDVYGPAINSMWKPFLLRARKNYKQGKPYHVVFPEE